MASLFDVFGRLLLEDGGKGFIADAAKAGAAGGDAASRTMGSRLRTGLQAGLSVGFKTLAVGASAAFGIAAKGALEMENATARYRAETGATAEEATRALTAVNQIAGRQRASLEAVTDVAIRVKRDLGAVGAEADKLTEDFVRFARVTRQDAAGAVSDFDDIIDNWGLSLADATTVMDKMLVSQQRFGGDIAANQKTLAALAPALKAANFNIEDGIALLGLFGAKGLDASQGSAAFAKALTKVKSPAELQQLIKDISATEDPFARAQKAADLFGARAGAKLANALGGANLDDYAISVEDAAGAVEKAGDALDSTFSAQIQRKISEAGAALRQFGADTGPAITGLASLAALGGSLGLDRVVAKGFGKLAGSALVKGAATKSGAVVGAIFTGAMWAGQTAAQGLAGMLGGLPGAGVVKGAASKAGGLLGTTLGKAGALAFAAVMVFEVFETYNRIKGELAAQNDAITAGVSDQIKAGTDAQLAQSKAALEQGLVDINKTWDAGIFTTDTRKRLEADLAATNAEIERRAAGVGPTVGEGLAAGAPAVAAGAKKMFGAAVPVAELMGTKIPESYADGILARADRVPNAMEELQNLLKNAKGRGQLIAEEIGFLTSKALAKGLKDGRGAVRKESARLQSEHEQNLARMIINGGKAGKKAQEELAKALRSKNPTVRAAAQRVKEIVNGQTGAIVKPAGAAGTAAGAALAEKLKAKLEAVQGQIANALSNLFTGHGVLPAGTTVTVSGGGGGAKKKAAGGPVRRDVPVIVGEKGWELFTPKVDGRIVSHADAVRGPKPTPALGGDTIIHMPVSGALPVSTITDISGEMQRIDDSGLLPTRRVAPAYHRRLVAGPGARR